MSGAIAIALVVGGMVNVEESTQTDAQIIDAILRREGGFVDHPADRGGATKYGITHARRSKPGAASR